MGDDVMHGFSFLASCVQLLDMSVLLQASLALFQAVPASVTLPLYPRHSAGDALLCRPGSTNIVPIDPAWCEEEPPPETGADGSGGADDSVDGPPEFHGPDGAYGDAAERLGQRAMDQWRQCEWWRKRAAVKLTPPILTVDDLLSFRTRCFVLDVRNPEEYVEGHFQASVLVRDPKEGDLWSIVPSEVLNLGGTPDTSSPCNGNGNAD